jgi:hypothetical protein
MDADFIIVLAIDRLNAAALGAYGNAAAQTRAFNRLAGDSWLSEFAFATTPDLQQAYDSLWRGKHPLAQKPGEPLGHRWSQSGWSSLLITDDATINARLDAEAFTDRWLLEPPPAQASAAGVAETQIAHLVSASLDRIATLEPRTAVWIHSRGLSGAWDAPLDLREQVRDEEDPPAATFIDPPGLQLGRDFDPDELLPISQAYAAQVLAIDECLELLLDALDDQKLLARSLLVVTSPRGLLLGQQGLVGASDALLEDQLHVPLFIRYPDGRRAAERDLGLREPRDLFSYFTSLDTSPPHRDRILMQSAREQALRTWAWHLRSIGEQHELYAKPDDRYEVNDVALRCQDVVEQLSEVARLTADAITRDDEKSLTPLAEVLTDAWR